MKYRVMWVIEGRVLYLQFPADVSYEMIGAVFAEVTRYIEASPAEIHIISDVRQVKRAPMSVAKLKEAMAVLRHQSVGWAITITNNSAFRFLAMIIPQVLGKHRFQVFSSLDAAVAFLYKQQPELAGLAIHCVGDTNLD